MMEIGKKILELRKKNNLSQEELAEKIGVARQTISKWELGDTSPDIVQTKKIAKLFNVSINEVVGNGFEEKMRCENSNIERLAGLCLKVIKIIGILFVVFLIIDVISFILFMVFKNDMRGTEFLEIEMNCSLDNNNYIISIGQDEYFNCVNCSEDLQKELENNYVDYDNLDMSVRNIVRYFEDNNGICE